MSKQVPFEKGDMDWLQGILDGQMDNLLSHGRTERIINRIAELEAQLDAVRTAPVTIKINADGQAWLVFNAGSGRRAMVNLNNIVCEMPLVGINRGICIDALSAALQGEKE
jgi:hypothetical protein